MPTRLLVSDACVLIDMQIADLSSAMFELDYRFAVSDVLFEEELRHRHSNLLRLGLQPLELASESIQRVMGLAARHKSPSRNDLIALSLAIQEGCTLITGDGALRAAAAHEGVDVRGTIWLVGEMLDAGLIAVDEAKQGYDEMRAAGSRLPWSEVAKQLRRYRGSR